MYIYDSYRIIPNKASYACTCFYTPLPINHSSTLKKSYPRFMTEKVYMYNPYYLPHLTLIYYNVFKNSSLKEILRIQNVQAGSLCLQDDRTESKLLLFNYRFLYFDSVPETITIQH